MPRPRQRARLEAGLKLDLNELLRDGLVKAGSKLQSTIALRQQYSDDIAVSGLLLSDLTYEKRGWMKLELGQSEHWINLVSVSRHFGGRQWYFLCRQTERIVSVLWKPPGGSCFLSRQAWGGRVAYNTQFETPRDRAQSGAQRIECRLGGTVDGPFPPKPKGMHWRTYEERRERYEAHEMMINFYLVRSASRYENR
jgi:hypothetical protein